MTDEPTNACPHCHRRRATREDVTRWEDEFGEGQETSDCPAWASAICWHVGKTRCYRKPIDRHAVRRSA